MNTGLVGRSIVGCGDYLAFYVAERVATMPWLAEAKFGTNGFLIDSDGDGRRFIRPGF